MNKTIKNNNYNFLLLIAMIYVAVDLASMVFTYKIIKINHIVGAASSLIFPLTYSIMDIVAEVYGYIIAKKIIWYGFACDLIFALLTLFITYIPSTTEYQTIAYTLVLGALLRAVFAQVAGVLSGAFINIYLISKWKLITNGRYFWLRSIGSSTIGEAIMLIVSVFIGLAGILSFPQLIRLIIYTYIYKIIFAIVVSPFVNLLAIILKNKEKDWQYHSVNFNPFNISGRQDSFANFQ